MRGIGFTTRVGDSIDVNEYDNTNMFDKKGSNAKVVKYTVEKIYPYHVLCINRYGIRRAFCYGTLVQLGIENSYAPISDGRLGAQFGRRKKGENYGIRDFSEL